jgi:hypothetical protein
MMNYRAQFNIAECCFEKITNPAFVGIFSDDAPMSLDSPAIGVAYRIRRSITITSYAGGGAGFPADDGVVRELTKQHSELLETYIKTIPQDKLYFFEDGSMYSLAMLRALVQIAKKFSKHVTCIAIEPGAYNGRRRMHQFESSWEVINELSDETHLLEFTPPDSKCTISEYYALKMNSVLSQLAGIESGLDAYDYYPKQG